MTQEYIITEEQLKEVLNMTIWGATNCMKFKNKLCLHNPAVSERETVLDADTIGTLLNIVEKDCSNLTTMERMAYRKAKRVEAELRRGE